MKNRMALLSEDMALEILVRLKYDAAALFRCATSCKRWYHLVASPTFLRRCWPEGTCPAIAGYFTGGRRDVQGPGSSCFVPAPRSALGRGCRALQTFAKHGSQILEGGEPLVSRHGLLLVRLARYNDTVLYLAVCNLLDGECHVLPPLKYVGVNNLSGYAILSGAYYKTDEPPGNSLSFKVVIIDSTIAYNLYMFSSGDRRWGTPTKCFSNPKTRCYNPVTHGAATMGNGMAHWLFYNLMLSSFYTIGMDARTGRVSVMKIPSEIDYTTCYKTVHPYLTFAIDGTLSLIYIQNDWPQLTIGKIWDRTAQWIFTRTIDLREPGESLARGLSDIYILQEKYGMVVIKDNSGYVYVVDLEAKIMEELLDWPTHHARCVEIVPLQIDWFAFFISRLGKLYQ